MQNEREKQSRRFFALIQKLNFIFADESFNELNTYFLLHLDTNESVSCLHNQDYVSISVQNTLEGYTFVDREQFNESKIFRACVVLLNRYATCDNVGTTESRQVGLLAADHGPLGMERATEHGSCAVNHKTKKKNRQNFSG